MRNTKQAFTLVELIVVITILAILGTIAFISLQGYSADARNSKRTSDLGNIQSSISLKMVEGVPLLSFVTTDSNNVISGINLGGSSTGITNDTIYNAGTPAYTVLNVAAKDFKDPKGDNEYRIGATTLQNGVFQVAAKMEIDGTPTAAVNGTFVARTTAGTTVDGDLDSTLKIVTLDDSAANTFKAGDFITDSASTERKVLKVSRDGVTVTLDGTATGSEFKLRADEDAGLITDNGAEGGVITNLDTNDLPY